MTGINHAAVNQNPINNNRIVSAFHSLDRDVMRCMQNCVVAGLFEPGKLQAPAGLKEAGYSKARRAFADWIHTSAVSLQAP
jgi:hypothetical protein